MVIGAGNGEIGCESVPRNDFFLGERQDLLLLFIPPSGRFVRSAWLFRTRIESTVAEALTEDRIADLLLLD